MSANAEGNVIDLSRRGLKPKPGLTWNPLSKFPRNLSCFCGSGRKFKLCCKEKIKPCCPIDDAKKVDQIIAQFGWDGIREMHRATIEHQAAHAARLMADSEKGPA